MQFQLARISGQENDWTLGITVFECRRKFQQCSIFVFFHFHAFLCMPINVMDRDTVVLRWC